MDSEEAAVIEDYESSLGDLTFNSKPLINVLTMLAEENSQHGDVIVKLIEKRIAKVDQLQKLPALYLLDSIIKNVGGEYLTLIAKVIDTVFTTVFEKADDKTRRDLHKLRNTWPQYFSTKKLYDLDVKVKNLDPAWPISSVPPQSPTIHINPKFLKKVEESPSPEEVVVKQDNVIQEHQSRLTQLQKLQEEQLKLTEREIEEHKLKRELLLKKQMQERKLLLQQQQEQVLRLRLLGEEQSISLDSSTDPSIAPNSGLSISEGGIVPLQADISTPNVNAMNNTRHSSVARDPRLRKNGPPVANTNARNTEIKSQDPRVQKPNDGRSGTGPVRSEAMIPHRAGDQLEQSRSRPNVISSAAFDGPSLRDNLMQQSNSRGHPFRREPRDEKRRNDERIEDLGSNRSAGGQSRRKFGGDRKRERRRGHSRGRGEHPQERPVRGPDRHDRQGQMEQRILNRENRHDDMVRRAEEPLPKKPKPLLADHEIMEIRHHRAASPVKGHPPPLSRMARPTPHRPMEFDNRHRVMGDLPPQEHEMLHHQDSHWQGNLPPDHPDHRGFEPGFEIPQELTLDHQAEILSQAERRLSTGELSKEQHHDLIEKLEQFYDLQRQQEHFRRISLDRQGFRPEHEEFEHQSEHHPDELSFRRMQKRFGHGQGHHIDREGPLQPHDHRRPLPPLDHQGPGRPVNNRHPDFPMEERQGQFGGHGGPGSENMGHRDFGQGTDHHQMGRERHPPVDREMPFGPDGERMRHGLQLDGQQRGPMRHGWLIDHPGHWQAEQERMLVPRPDTGRASPCIGIDGPGGESLRGADRADPGFRGVDMAQRPPAEQNRGQLGFGPGRPTDSMGGIPMEVDRPLKEPVLGITMPQTPPRDPSASDRGSHPFTPNTMFEKKSVDDLFQRLVNVGIIKVMPEQGHNSPARAATPPLPPSQLVSVQQNKPMQHAPAPKIQQKEETIPEIKLIPTDLKKRHSAIISKLSNGTQCSSCGLRFPEDVAAMYREHLDWHFRINRREKDGRRIAHRQWYITLKDWLSYEEIGDPEERAHSSVFDVVKGATGSDSLDTAADKEDNSDSTPVLDGDGEAEAVSIS